MFPFRDHNPSGRTPVVTYGLIAINCIVFVMYWPLFDDQVALSAFYDTWAMQPDQIARGDAIHTTVTSMFLHGGLLHLLGNMLFLYIYGDNIEDVLGHFGFAAFYAVAGFAAAGLHIATNPASDIPVVGASGAISGVMGAYLLLYPKAKVDIALVLVIFFKIFTLPAYIVLGLWMLFQLFNGFATVGTDSGVAYWAHVGGFAAGVIVVLPVWLRLGGTAFWLRSLYHPPHAPTFDTRTTTIPVVRRKRR